MPTTRKDKEKIVLGLKEKLVRSSFIAFLNFHGMSVAKATELRRNLRKEGSEYLVARKTLLGVAAREAGLEVDQKKLDGEVAIVFGGTSEDTNLSAAKQMVTFAKKNAEILKVIGGFWNKVWVEPTEVKRLASIPPRETLLTQLAYMLTQPAAKLARVLTEASKKLENK